MSKFVVVDVETTGFRKSASVCQLSYLIFVDGLVQSGKNFFFSVDHMEEGARKIHGLTIEKLEELSGGLQFSDAAEEIIEDFSNAVFVAHNADFDYRMIQGEFTRAGLVMPNMPKFCTMKLLAPIVNLPRNKYPKLQEAMDYYNITDKPVNYLLNQMFGLNSSATHDARYDAVLTACIIYIGEIIPSILSLCFIDSIE